MKFNDLKIKTQLGIYLGLICLFVLILGVIAWVDVESLWRNTEGLYSHPFQVRRAVGDIKADIIAIHREMKDLVLAKSREDKQKAIQNIDAYEGDAHRQFDILNDRYLGPKRDIDEAHSAFVRWKAIRDHTIELINEGRTEEAADRTRSSGVGGGAFEKIMGLIQKVSDFAQSRADDFFQGAEKNKDSVFLRLKIVISAIFTLSIGVGYLLLKGIRSPLNELTSVTEQYRQGNLAARSGYVSSNEFGSLSASFNDLAETIQSETQSRQNAAKISEVMLREEELRPFCRSLLKSLMEQTDSQIGAVYLLDDQKTDFQHFESVGLSNPGRQSFSAQKLEGEFGAALATGQIQRVTDIPADTRFCFHTVSADISPREIMTIPIFSANEAVGMISLASVKGYDEAAVKLMNDVWNVMTARLNGVLVFRRVQEFSEKLQIQNTELENQKRELALQADELTEQNMELDMQKKQLDQANRLKSSFLSNMSHELRTPLNSVIALSGVLIRRLKGSIPEEEHGYIEVIERNGKNLLDLINDLLDLSRIEAGREEIKLTSFSVRRLLEDVTEMIQPLASEKNIAMVNLVDHDLPPITSDISKCRHILENILGNAVKFTEQGKVEISARYSDGNVFIAVADTGIGISPEEVPHIFDEFRQADESASRRFGGSGLGLAIANKYALLLHGDITVKTATGAGSTFILRLPMEIHSSLRSEKHDHSGPYHGETESSGQIGPRVNEVKNILLVEDSEPAVIQIMDILSEQGFRVQVARNGKEALEQIDIMPPDAMILDLMMPEVDGFEVLRTIRGREKTAGLPVLILTAKHITRDELKVLEGNNVQQLIAKGAVSKRELLAAVNKMVFPSQGNETRGLGKTSTGRDSDKSTILVIEDNPDNMMTVKALLRETCNIIEASNGEAGLDCARMFKPDLVLLDISLPVMDGFEVLAQIRKLEYLNRVPVIALTARAMKGSKEEIMAHGFDAYISKPIDGERLRKTIREILYAD